MSDPSADGARGPLTGRRRAARPLGACPPPSLAGPAGARDRLRRSPLKPAAGAADAGSARRWPTAPCPPPRPASCRSRRARWRSPSPRRRRRRLLAAHDDAALAGLRRRRAQRRRRATPPSPTTSASRGHRLRVRRLGHRPRRRQRRHRRLRRLPGRPVGANGSPWRAGRTVLASQGLGGAPANGRSYAPALDGDSHHVPRCVGFISDASNLVAGDTNGVADAFVRDLRNGHTCGCPSAPTAEADGPSTTSRSTATAPAWPSPPPPPTSTSPRPGARPGGVPARPRAAAVATGLRPVLRGGGQDRGLAGLTFLASATNHGRAGNGDSGEVALARNGKSLVFSSTSVEPRAGDRNGVSDVFRRRLTRIRMHRGLGLQVPHPPRLRPRARRRQRAVEPPRRHRRRALRRLPDRRLDLLPGDSDGHTTSPSPTSAGAGPGTRGSPGRTRSASRATARPGRP